MNGNNPLVSVIISAYNHEKYIQYTIKSIINQSYKNIELLIIDDGSIDNTWSEIQKMKAECEKRFSNVMFRTKPNEGSCITLNKLLKSAKGKYVYLIASDDMAKPNAIEKETEFLENNPDYALVVGDNEIIDFDNNQCYWDKKRNLVYSKKQAKYLTFGDFLQKQTDINFNSSDFGSYKTLYISNYIPNGYLIRKSIFEKTGYFTPKAPLEDYYLMLQISKYSKMKYLDEVLFSYRWHNSNTIKNKSKIKLYTNLTREYEEEILAKINENDVLPDVLEVKNKGVFYKKQGIPFIFELLTYKKGLNKIKIFKLFNIKIFKMTKSKRGKMHNAT